MWIQVCSCSSLSVCSLKSSTGWGFNFSPQKAWDQRSLPCRTVMGKNVKAPPTELNTHSIGIPNPIMTGICVESVLKEVGCRRRAKDSSREQCQGLGAAVF